MVNHLQTFFFLLNSQKFSLNASASVASAGSFQKLGGTVRFAKAPTSSLTGTLSVKVLANCPRPPRNLRWSGH